jgi:methylenetetrahydrofolate dehydrogenase (NADP+) / methenyltetrahydrofolate cyclohydrolase
MIVDGRQIAEELADSMRAFTAMEGGDFPLTLTALAVEPDVPTQQFLRIKARVAKLVGAKMDTVLLPVTTSTEEVLAVMKEVLTQSDGIVLQLPFPPHIDVPLLLGSLPIALDPDCLGSEARDALAKGTHTILPPVVSALALIVRRYQIPLEGRHAVIVGQGRLVGAPAGEWLLRAGARVTRFTRESGVDPHIMRTADMVILGAGVPGLVTPGMLKAGVVLFDAGTSEEGGRVVGDADPACAEKASIFTPVPGGIGPIAVAELFGNMLRLRTSYREDIS